MRERKNALLRYSISILLTVGLLFVAFRGTDLDRLKSAIVDAQYSWFVLMFVLLMGSHIVRAWRWRFLLDPIKPRIGMRNLFAAVMIGYFVNNILPRAGEVARPYSIGRLESISKASALGTVVVERLLDFVSLLFLFAIIPLVYDGPLRKFFPWLNEAGIIMGVLVGAIVIVSLILLFRRDLASRLLGLISKILPARWEEKFHHVGHSFLDGFLFLKRPGDFLVVSLMTAVVWFLYIAMLFVAFKAFPFSAQLGWRAALVLLAISSIGIIIPTPGSTGGYHVLTSQALIRLFETPDNLALGYATLTHAVAYIGTTIVGAYYVFHDHIKVSEALRDEGENSE